MCYKLKNKFLTFQHLFPKWNFLEIERKRKTVMLQLSLLCGRKNKRKSFTW